MIQIKWNRINKKHYIECGYDFTNIGDLFWVDVKDLLPSSKEKIKVQCDYCGKIYEKTFCKTTSSANYPKVYCKKCVSKIISQKTLEKRQNKIWKDIFGFCKLHNYIILTNKKDIKGVNSRVQYKCPLHGVREVYVKNLLDHKQCRLCANVSYNQDATNTRKESNQDKWFRQITNICQNENYVLLSNKQNMLSSTSYITYHCDDQTHKNHTMRISNFLSGKRCPECFYKRAQQKYSTSSEEVERRISECGGVLLNKDNYINQTTKNLKILCPKCKKEFFTSLRNFTQHGGQLCPKCSNSNESIGESYIRAYLEKHNINFEKEKWFSDCRDQNPLPFDFYIPKMNTIIEFDGRQHFKETDHFSYSLKMIQKHDEIKNNYCHDHNINLIRIPYTQMNKIDNILNKKLNLHEDIV